MEAARGRMTGRLHARPYITELTIPLFPFR